MIAAVPNPKSKRASEIILPIMKGPIPNPPYKQVLYIPMANPLFSWDEVSAINVLTSTTTTPDEKPSRADNAKIINRLPNDAITPIEIALITKLGSINETRLPVLSEYLPAGTLDTALDAARSAKINPIEKVDMPIC
jgi:hypothetical protein